MTPSKKLLTFMVIALMVVGLAGASFNTRAGLSYDEGDDRYILLTLDETNSTAEANVSLPEIISSNYTVDYELDYTVNDGTDGLNQTYNFTVEIQGKSFTDSLDVDNNDTYSSSLELQDLTTGENETISLTLENTDTSTTDDWEGLVDVEDDVTHMFEGLADIMIAIIPLMVVIWVIGFIYEYLEDLKI